MTFLNTVKQVVAATDFSGPARHATDRAAWIAAAAGARMRLVHVVAAGTLDRLQQMLGRDSAAEKSLLGEAEQTLQREAAELRSNRGAAVEVTLARGAVLECIADQAESIQADLLVVGARGAGFMRRMMLGSNAERLLRKTLRPLLVVKQRAHEPYRRVLVPVDFSAWSAQGLASARRVAPGAHLVLLHAYEVPFEGKLWYAGVDAAKVVSYREQVREAALRQLHAIAADAGLTASDWTPCVLLRDASAAIVEQEQEMDCDLIVIGKHGQSMAEELLLGSVTRQVLTDAAGDVLVSMRGSNGSPRSAQDSAGVLSRSASPTS